MVQSVRATYRDGVLEPSESVGNGVVDAFHSKSESQTGPDNGEHPLLQRLRKIRESVPASAWDDVPSDGAKNYKHYLYGHPKEDEE